VSSSLHTFILSVSLSYSVLLISAVSTYVSTLSLHDALPICHAVCHGVHVSRGWHAGAACCQQTPHDFKTMMCLRTLASAPCILTETFSHLPGRHRISECGNLSTFCALLIQWIFTRLSTGA